MTALAEPRLESDKRKPARVRNEVLVDVAAELEARVREYRLVAEAPLLRTLYMSFFCHAWRIISIFGPIRKFEFRFS